MVAIRRMRPPASTSLANARCMSAGEVQYRGLLFIPPPCPYGTDTRWLTSGVGSGRDSVPLARDPPNAGSSLAR